MSGEAEPARGRGRWIAAASLVAALAAVVFATYGRALSFELLGHDTYPLIVASRVSSLGDFVDLFTEPLLDGDFGIGYWRPVPGVLLALEHALGGASPRIYHVTDLLLLLGAGVALLHLARRLTGGLIGPAIVALLYVLFHAQFEALPVPSRRPHTLCVLFLALSLAALVGERRRPLVAGLCAFAAMLSNEVALVAFPLAFATAFLVADGAEPPAGPEPRAKRALRAALPAGVATLVALGARALVLDGLGGPESADLPELSAWARLARHVFVPQPHLVGPTPVVLGLIAIGVGATGLAWVPRSSPHRAPARRALRAAGVGLAWMLCVALPIVASGKLRHWYAVQPGAGFALVAGALAQGWATTLRTDRGVGAGVGHGLPRLLTTTIGAAGVAWALFLSVAASPLVLPYEQWSRGSRAQREFLEALRPRIAAAPDGTILEVNGLPVRAVPLAGDSLVPGDPPIQAYDARVASPALMNLASLRAFARLEFPEREFVVRSADAELVPAPANGLLLRVTPAAPGSGLR